MPQYRVFVLFALQKANDLLVAFLIITLVFSDKYKCHPQQHICLLRVSTVIPFLSCQTLYSTIINDMQQHLKYCLDRCQTNLLISSSSTSFRPSSYCLLYELSSIFCSRCISHSVILATQFRWPFFAESFF